MATKDKEQTREQKILMASKGLMPCMYEVLFDAPHTMIVRHIETKKPEIIYKDQPGRIPSAQYEQP